MNKISKRRLANQKWYQKNKERKLLSSKNWAQSEKGKVSKTKSTIKYFKTKKGKIARHKTRAKTMAKRKRELNWILMFENPFDDIVPVDYHHVTDAYVVAIPKDLHQLYCGKYHRENMMEIVKQIYLNEG